MRNLLILLLGGAVIWLFIERNRLTDELAVAKTEMEKSQKRVEELEKAATAQRGGNRPGTPGAPNPNWLNERINSTRALDTNPPKGR